MLSYSTVATYLLSRLVDKLSPQFSFLRNQLVLANIKLPLRTYLSTAFFTSLLVFFVTVAGLLLAIVIFEINIMKVPFLLTIPIFLPLLCFLGFIYYPSHRVSSRRKNIETNLPFVLAHMGSIAEAGVPPYVIFKLIAEFEEYGEISKEMQKLVRNIDTFGLDPLTAVKELAERTPSKEFKQILLGIVTTTETGGDIKLYLKDAGERALFNWRTKREKFMQQLSAYAEFYTGILIAAPLFIISLFSVMNMIQPQLAGFNIIDLARLSIYILVPAINIGFLAFLRGVEVEI